MRGYGTTLLGAAAAGLLAGAASADVLLYELQDLGSLGGDVRALGMNDVGAVVGWARTSDGSTHGFTWSQETGMMDLGTLGGMWAEARNINDLGQAVGVATTPDGRERAAYWYGGEIYDLNDVLPPGFVFRRAFDDILKGSGGAGPGASPAPSGSFVELTAALAINNAGAIVGCGTVQGEEMLRGFILLPTGPDLPLPKFTCVDLGTLPGAEDCIPYAVNDSNEVVGVSGQWAFVWRKEQLIVPLDELARTVWFESQANGISENGVAAGWYLEIGPQQACLWTGDGRTDLPFLPGWASAAQDVNDAGAAVGWVLEVGGATLSTRRAAAWFGTNAFDLNDVTAIKLRDLLVFPWSALDEATAIDSTGRIAGYGHATDGRLRGFVLTPIEPP
jgi:probable HAF family extracellular repeat protein